MEPTKKEINDLRSSFFKRCGDEVIVKGPMHPNDLYRAKTDDSWLRRFLLHHDNNQKEALNMMIETCEWRIKFGTNDISEKNVSEELLKNGSVFSHGKDKDGKTLLIFKSKKHVKGAHNFDDLKRHLVYWMERLEREGKGEMISIFFDMDGAGLSNMDMEYTKLIISLFNNYYPHFLNYIIVFEMAWVFNATFNIIKSWLPPKAIKKIRFVNKSNLKELVDPVYALESWGGTNDYVYTFNPENKTLHDDILVQEFKRKVHFADRSPTEDDISESGFIEPTLDRSANSMKLSVTPSHELPFLYEGSDLIGSFVLKNHDVKCWSYKIKTTSPKKFRVRPSIGILSPNMTETINVVLQAGYEIFGLNRDKFLIMSIPVSDGNISQESLLKLWKNTSEEEMTRYKLRCGLSITRKKEDGIVNGSAFDSQSLNGPKLSNGTSDLAKVCMTVNNLREEVKVIQRQQLIIAAAIVFLACIIAYISGSSSDTSHVDHNSWVMNSTEEL